LKEEILILVLWKWCGERYFDEKMKNNNCGVENNLIKDVTARNNNLIATINIIRVR